MSRQVTCEGDHRKTLLDFERPVMIHGPPDLPEVSRTYENLPYRK